MPIEQILIDGRHCVTLKELLRPGLRAVFVGINPSPKSVSAGHYYQGRHGQRLWKRLRDSGIVKFMESGREDEFAFQQGIGFADMVRRPTFSGQDLSSTEIRERAKLLIQRLVELGDPRPIVVFVYAKAAKECESALRDAGFATLRMPGPYEKKETANQMMLDISEKLGNR